jgi:hypothetical protein
MKLTLVRKILQWLAQVVLNQTSPTVVVKLLAGSSADVEHIDDHCRVSRVVSVATNITFLVITDGSVVCRRLRGDLRDLTGLVDPAARLAMFGNLFLALPAAFLEVGGHLDSQLNTSSTTRVNFVKVPLDALDSILTNQAEGVHADEEAQGEQGSDDGNKSRNHCNSGSVIVRSLTVE